MESINLDAGIDKERWMERNKVGEGVVKVERGKEGKDVGREQRSVRENEMEEREAR